MKQDTTGSEETEVSHGSLTMRHVRLSSCIKLAYGAEYFQITGPAWVNEQRYSIFAKAGAPAADDQLKQMLRTLLAERFKLRLRRETREREMAVITVGKNGPKLHPSETEGEGVIRSESDRTVFRATTMSELASFLSGGGATTMDMTGLKGRFDFTLDYGRHLDRTSENQNPMRLHNDALRVAVQEELGLKLELKKVPVEMLVVEDALRTPTEN